MEAIARDYHLRGFVYTDKSGFVKIVCEGVRGDVDGFLDDLQRISRDVEIEKKEIRDEAFLPDEFGRVVVEDEYSLRLDRGLELLGGIKNNQKTMIGNQSSMIDNQKTMIKLLRKISEK
ncbi:MAG: acylphosphatase [Candidatus Hydrothermarchaeales archaeon]